jgi:anaerobic magnesium-protoporphyrin IX monomethyl ester cyclase
MARILLINPSYEPSYGGTKVGIINPVHPTLGLATIAATARARGHQVKILDLSWRPYDFAFVRSEIVADKPDIVGITATTPLMNQLRDISVMVKDISPAIAVVGGGPHVSALPVESMRESLMDAVFVGEADYSFADYCDASDPATVKGIHYRKGDDIVSTGLRPLVQNLDDLPMPAWDLYDTRDYHRISRLVARRRPMTIAEFSRGCVFKCDFCASKTTAGLGYRKKSPERCAEEVKRMHALGFREFWLADDIFTSDQEWATEVAEKIIAADTGVLWTCHNGIRVESADRRMFHAMRKAGCYRVNFGFESGNDAILKSFGKGGKASVEQGRVAVNLARKAGLDTSGSMLLGLSHDTEETMRDTIEYARQLPLDMMKFGVCIAFPGTRMFKEYAAQGLVRSYNWDSYFFYTDESLFVHRNLTYDKIREYMNYAYKRAILFNPGFAWRRLLRGVRTGEFFWDMYYALKFFMTPASRSALMSLYYARDRWPEYDFKAKPPVDEPFWQVVRKSAPEVRAAE